LARDPNLFIVGAPKSGTTAMHEYLRAHPQIYMSAYKEPYYFGADLVGPRMAQFRGKLTKYRGLFADATNERWIGESSIWYLYSRTAACEIKQFSPTARIMIMLRNPLEVSYSMYYQSRFTGNEILLTFEEALQVEPERLQGRGIPRMSHTYQGLLYTEICRYTDQVKRYFDVFGRDAVHVIIYDDFKRDTAGEYRKTLEWLDVDPTFTTAFTVINANKQVRNPALQNFMLRVGISPMLLKDRLNYAAAAYHWLPPRVRARLLTPVTSAYTRFQKRPDMKLETRIRLQSIFLPELERLSTLLNRDLTGWCNP
jgi:hypothetical protein